VRPPISVDAALGRGENGGMETDKGEDYWGQPDLAGWPLGQVKALVAVLGRNYGSFSGGQAIYAAAVLELLARGYRLEPPDAQTIGRLSLRT
jgi:hypothetical protein